MKTADILVFGLAGSLCLACLFGATPVYVGCGRVGPDTKCSGCNSVAETCQCFQSHCKNEGKDCTAVPVSATEGNKKIYKVHESCWQRTYCNNTQGVNGGPCIAAGECRFSTIEFEGADCEQSPGECRWRYYEDGDC